MYTLNIYSFVHPFKKSKEKNQMGNGYYYTKAAYEHSRTLYSLLLRSGWFTLSPLS